MNGYKGSEERLIGLVKALSQVNARADIDRALQADGSFRIDEVEVPRSIRPSGFRVDMFGNEPDYHEAHIRVVYKGGCGNFALSDGRTLNGNIESKYVGEIRRYISEHLSDLKECWDELKAMLGGRKPKTAWWGSDDWKDDPEDDSSPASCRLLVIAPTDTGSQECKDQLLDVRSISCHPASRFAGLALDSELCVGYLQYEPASLAKCRQVTLLDKFDEGATFTVELPWLGENTIETLAATLGGLTFSDLRCWGQQ